MQLKRFHGRPDFLKQLDKTIRAYFDMGRVERVTCYKDYGKLNT